jgi:hypothetical protein
MTNRIEIPTVGKFPEGTKFFGGCSGGGQEESSSYPPKGFTFNPYGIHRSGERVFTDNKYTKTIGGVINNFVDIAVAANNELVFKIKRADAEDRMDRFLVPSNPYHSTYRDASLWAKTINKDEDGVEDVSIGCKEEVPTCYGLCNNNTPIPEVADRPSLISLNGKDLHGMFIPFSCDPKYYNAIIKYVEALKSNLQAYSATDALKDANSKPSFEDKVKFAPYSGQQFSGPVAPTFVSQAPIPPTITQECPQYPYPYPADPEYPSDGLYTPPCPAEEDVDKNE